MPIDTREELRTLGYSLLPADRFPIDPEFRRFEERLAGEWDRLEVDKYLKNGSRFRERRYDRFRYDPRTGEIRLRPHRPYFQSGHVNDYAGGIERDVAPLSHDTLDNPLLTALLRADFAQFPVPEEWLDDPWDVQCHQFRIISTEDELGEPTPEGPHRDEVDFGAIHLMNRVNAAGGESQVYSESKELITEFCLSERMDTMFWADQKVLHAVRPITAVRPGTRAVRDVLILGYKRSPGLPIEV
ncbi:2OG-Fe dioxygenase family protein [Streptomyces spinoverrucosus]|uniref:2OG-Fe dioxygenase family protein n=1 Tax=Streptomyces spinoverrucosus TaxID=284043 RepID=UPI0027DA4C53|nr:2OG-Fe dioxygenase family protein [Streptomyces spinoverrucosus]